jgi:hypothetical protein
MAEIGNFKIVDKEKLNKKQFERIEEESIKLQKLRINNVAEVASGKMNFKLDEVINNSLLYLNMNKILGNRSWWSDMNNDTWIITTPWNISFKLDSYDNKKEYNNKNAWFKFMQLMLAPSVHFLVAYLLVRIDSKELEIFPSDVEDEMDGIIEDVGIAMDPDNAREEDFEEKENRKVEKQIKEMKKDSEIYYLPDNDDDLEAFHKKCLLSNFMQVTVRDWLLKGKKIRKFLDTKGGYNTYRKLLQLTRNSLWDRRDKIDGIPAALKLLVKKNFDKTIGELDKQIGSRDKFSSNYVFQGAKAFAEKDMKPFNKLKEGNMDKRELYLKNESITTKFLDRSLQLIFDFKVLEVNKPFKVLRFDEGSLTKKYFDYEYKGKKRNCFKESEKIYFKLAPDYVTTFKMLMSEKIEDYPQPKSEEQKRMNRLLTREERNNFKTEFIGVNDPTMVDTIFVSNNFDLEQGIHKNHFCFYSLVPLIN